MNRPDTAGSAPAVSALSADLLTVGIIHFDDYDSMADCRAALSAQTFQPLQVIVVDNTPAARRRPLAGDPRLGLSLEVNEVNNGYAGAANQLIRRSETPFVFLMNPDVRLDPRCLETLLRRALSMPEYGVWGPKLLRAPGLLDSAGHDFVRSRRFRDRGPGEPDRDQYADGDVFAICGAAILLRREALRAIEIDGEYFDEDFFVYHEDSDLCWRAWHRGWRVRYVPAARAFHRRGWKPGPRAKVPWRVRAHSFKNRYLEMAKNETPSSFARDLPFILLQEVLRFVHALFREPVLLSAYVEALRLLPKALVKRRRIMAGRKKEPFHTMFVRRRAV